MKPEWRRFAPLGLWLAGAAAVTSVVLYILQRELTLALQISLGLIVIGLAIFAILDPERVRKLLTGRTARYGSNAVVLVIASIGILVVLNYLANQNDKRWDLTEDKENTLAPETIDILKNLPAPVVVRAFYTPDTAIDSAESLLDQFAYQSDGKLSYEFIDPVSDPVAATEANITQDGTLVLTMGEAKESTTFVTEEEVTSALVRLMNPGEAVIYFLTGHGEYDLEGGADDTYTQLKEKLEGKNYTVSPLNLLSTSQIPEDAEVIVIAGPVVSLADSEIALLTDYQSNGGALVVMEEPVPLTQMGEDPDLLSEYLSQNWGVVLGKDIVVDLRTNQAFMAYADQYGNHPITQKMRNIATAFPTARSVTVTDAISNGASQTQLILTSDQSWAETDLAGLETGTIQPDPDSDLMGPVSLAVAAENFNSGARLVTFGDAEFATNAYLSAYGNTDMIINSIDWAAGQEDLINLTPKESTSRVLATPNTMTLGLLFLGSMIVLPGIVIAGGITAWLVRRRHG
jgi:ABC-type uncharacterized transport system involved in gliding motility auxiliary subunit